MAPELFLTRVARDLTNSGGSLEAAATREITLMQQGKPWRAELVISSQGSCWEFEATVHRSTENDSDDAFPLWLLILMVPVGLIFATGFWLLPLCLAAALYVVWPILAGEIAIRRRLTLAVANSLRDMG